MTHRTADFASAILAFALASLFGGAGALPSGHPVPDTAGSCVVETDSTPRSFELPGAVQVRLPETAGPSVHRQATDDRARRTATPNHAWTCIRAAAVDTSVALRPSPLALGHPATAPPAAV